MNHIFKRPLSAFQSSAIFAVIAFAIGIMLTFMLAGCSGSNQQQESTDQSNDQQKVKVVASFYPMYDFAQKIGGDRVEVTNLVPAGTEPHDWEPSTADMQTIEGADVLVYNGAGMEHWVDDTLASLQNDKLVSCEASKGISLLNAAEEEHAHADENHADEADHDHGQYDPHVWLAPENAKQEMRNIADTLEQVDPDGRDTYEANYNKYADELDQLDKQFSDELSKVPNKNVVVSHQAFAYLCNAYGLTQMPISGVEADTEPDAKTMAEITDFVKQNNVKVIFSEDLVSPKVAQSIADATGAQCEVLNPLEGLTDEQLSAGDDYFSVMKSNLDELVKALS